MLENPFRQPMGSEAFGIVPDIAPDVRIAISINGRVETLREGLRNCELWALRNRLFAGTSNTVQKKACAGLIAEARDSVTRLSASL